MKECFITIFLEHCIHGFLARQYQCTGRAIALGVSVGVAQMLKFLVKVFVSLYLLIMSMD